MGREIEIKLRMDNPATVRRRLAEAAAQTLGTADEEDVFFDFPDGRLHAGGLMLRVRTRSPAAAQTPAGSTSPEPSTHAGKALLTFKGPRREAPEKIREEIETGVERGDELVRILERLGLVARLRCRKRRESWRLGGCTVALDALDRLGTFVEIEGPTVAAVRAARAQLALADAEVVEETYAELSARAAHPGADDGRPGTQSEPR